MAEEKLYCTFFLGDAFFGVDVPRVREVIRKVSLTPVPLASGEISGLINLRGQIVTSIDLRRRLGLDDRPANHHPMSVIIEDEGELISLLVDTISDVVEVGEDRFEETPETLTGSARELIQGAYKLEERLLLILDTDKVVELPSTDGPG